MKESAESYFVEELSTRNEIINSPGFIIVQLSQDDSGFFMRDVLLSEYFLINLEESVVKKFGEKGRKILYSIGKKYGYAISGQFGFPNKKEVDKEKILGFIEEGVRFLNSTWAKDIKHEENIEGNIWKLKLYDYVVCRKNGIGLILSEGTLAGVWSFLMREEVDGVQTKCEGRGEKNCEVVVAPKSFFKKNKIKSISETDLELVEIDDAYLSVNKIRPTNYSSKSLRDLIDSKLVKYKNGRHTIENERFFEMETVLLSIIENEMSKIKGGSEVLFQVSSSVGKRLAKKAGKDPQIFVSDYMGAMGWGDLISNKDKGKYSLSSNYFPWDVFSKDSKFVIFRGIVSGIFSQILKKEITFKKSSSYLGPEGFVLSISE